MPPTLRARRSPNPTTGLKSGVLRLNRPCAALGAIALAAKAQMTTTRPNSQTTKLREAPLFTDAGIHSAKGLNEKAQKKGSKKGLSEKCQLECLGQPL